MGGPSGYAPAPSSVLGVGWADDLGHREEMEDGYIFADNFLQRKECAYFAVYDGHGGRGCVDYVLEYLHLNLTNELGTPTEHLGGQHDKVRGALSQAFSVTDQQVLQHGIHTSGCTACSCLVLKDKSTGKRTLYTAHVGDARAVIARGGRGERLTSMSDHKATDPEEEKRVLDAGGTVYNERVNGQLAISRAFGDHQLKAPYLSQSVVSNSPDITVLELTEDDFFVIVACDGLWDVMDDQTAVNHLLCVLPQIMPNIGVEISLSAVCECLARVLVEAALNLGSTDNVSCMVVFLSHPW